MARISFSRSLRKSEMGITFVENDEDDNDDDVYVLLVISVNIYVIWLFNLFDKPILFGQRPR